MSEVTETAQATTTAATEKEVTATAPVTTPAETTKESPAPDQKEAIETKEAPPAESVEKPADKPVVPEKYELKLGKDSPLDASDIAKIEADAKAQGLSNEDAQKLVEGKESAFAEFHGRQQEFMKSQQKAWVDEIQADKEIGGKNLKENIEIAHRGMNRWADDEFKKVLSQTGLGNNPHLIRTFYRIGKAMENDRAVLDGKASAPPKKASRESKLYPKMHKTEE